jgi:AraC-like DNA-binding protein
VPTLHSGSLLSRNELFTHTPQKDLNQDPSRHERMTQASPLRNGAKADSCERAILDKRVRKVLEMVESGQPCTIHGLAHQLHLTHFHLLHLFKQQVGVPLGEVLTEQKLSSAARLLAEGHVCIKQIAHAAGYEHTSSFARAFRRRFGVAPRRYREQRSQEKLRNSA